MSDIDETLLAIGTNAARFLDTSAKSTQRGREVDLGEHGAAATDHPNGVRGLATVADALHQEPNLRLGEDSRPPRRDQEQLARKRRSPDARDTE
jgi:hypothetical protein